MEIQLSWDKKDLEIKIPDLKNFIKPITEAVNLDDNSLLLHFLEKIYRQGYASGFIQGYHLSNKFMGVKNGT
ncbi:MAG: hypothetical protein N2560_01620 [Ignavibacteria bacterium]|nr:hypothetical protein [Ignavibacteria bacterium]